MVVSHDPTRHARLSYTWLDECHHLFDVPEPTVVLVSRSVSQGEPYPTPELAEAAFWRAITDSILSHERRVVSVAWPKVNAEAAVLIDHETGLFHLACRDGRAAGARWFTDEAEARAAWVDVVRILIADRFDDWTVWTSDTGRWWATRHADLTEAEINMAVSRTLNADTPERLVELLPEQEQQMGRAR